MIFFRAMRIGIAIIFLLYEFVDIRIDHPTSAMNPASKMRVVSTNHSPSSGGFSRRMAGHRPKTCVEYVIQYHNAIAPAKPKPGPAMKLPMRNEMNG